MMHAMFYIWPLICKKMMFVTKYDTVFLFLFLFSFLYISILERVIILKTPSYKNNKFSNNNDIKNKI